MCGVITAITNKPIDVALLEQAMSVMKHRGPDDKKSWQGDGVFMGHLRLSIIDLDSRAAQPMHSKCGRFTIVFNGEIYNFRDLRLELQAKGEIFHTASDTEVILSLFASEGASMLKKLQGMFALVIWDNLLKKAFAARDPYGIKPLYFAHVNSGIILCSQVKALIATGLVDTHPDLVGQAGYWMLGSVPEPYTCFKEIRSLRAGHCLWIEKSKIIEQYCWYDIASNWRSTDNEKLVKISKKELQKNVRQCIIESIDRHLVSDVPIGVFLSGGVDSGSLAGLMKERGTSDIIGVTIAYDEYTGLASDESPIASKIASYYGIKHYVRKVSRNEFISDLPRILTAMDQPSIDGINTWYASKAIAEQGLKVVVSGVGGDELFFGYDSFRQLPRLVDYWKVLSKFGAIETILSSISNFQAHRSGNKRWLHLPKWLNNIQGAWWLKRSCMAPETAAMFMIDEIPKQILNFAPDKWLDWMSGTVAIDSKMALAQIESTTYLRNQLLRDSDWASMDHSVELRTPLVDAHLLSNLRSMLPHLPHFPGKSLLANSPSKPLPDIVQKRSKTGFSIPINKWIFDYLGRDTSWQIEVAKNAGFFTC
jgi:asparagine synthase (glutamine-hydrolysing)